MLTYGDQIFLPDFYDKVFFELRDDIAGLTLVSNPHFRKFLWDSFLFMSLPLFASEIIRQVKLRIKGIFQAIFTPSKKKTIQTVCLKHGVPFSYTKKINSKEFRLKLKAQEIDLIISVACPQILKKKILDLPRNGCINIHYGLLPEYRGMYPSFWVLANGERETGVSVHYMKEKIDAGDILVQKREEIRPDDTFYSLVRRLKTTIGPETLLKAVRKIKNGETSVIHNDPDRGSYYSFPSKTAMKKFRALGRKWF